MLASAFDTVADTEMAIETYEAMEQEDDRRLYYLAIYGLLQAMYVQQDAVEAMMWAFEPNAEPRYKIENEPDAVEVREVRNKAIGHPTKDGDIKSKKKPGVQMSYHIVQRSIHKGGFTVLTAYANRDSTFTPYSIPDLILKNRTAVARVLQRIYDKLQAAEMGHRQSFRDEKLAAIFPEMLSYYFEKIFSGTRTPRGDRGEFAKIHVPLIAEVVREFRQALEKRGLLNSSSNYEYYLAEVEYPIQELLLYFEGEGSLKNAQSADIFVYFVREHMDKLRAMAEELDEEYGSEAAEA